MPAFSYRRVAGVEVIEIMLIIAPQFLTFGTVPSNILHISFLSKEDKLTWTRETGRKLNGSGPWVLLHNVRKERA